MLDALSCPAPFADHDRVLLGHGSGGRMSADLLRRVFLAAFDSEVLAALEDQATIRLPAPTPLAPPYQGGDGGVGSAGKGSRLAFTTDAFVVRPLFFPGGDIGKLAVCGTINDLAVGGATPRFLSAAFILEEGLPLADLERIVASMRAACAEAGVAVVTGDTKVVDRGKGDGVFITTSGIGVVPDDISLSVRNPQPGDCILLSGTIGDHGIAVMSVREGLEFETALESDCACLADLTRRMLEACPRIRWMRDPTRGGLSSALNELAVAAHVGVKIDEAALPIRPEVRAGCEMLGLDPMYVASEGKLIAAVPATAAERLLQTMRGHPLGTNAALIGEAVAEHPGMVTMKTLVGGERLVIMLSGEQLPRIC